MTPSKVEGDISYRGRFLDINDCKLESITQVFSNLQ